VISTDGTAALADPIARGVGQMKLAKVLVDLFKMSAEPAFSKVALAPVVDLPHPPQAAVNPLQLLGLYRD
jgi:hypothetical protein